MLAENIRVGQNVRTSNEIGCFNALDLSIVRLQKGSILTKLEDETYYVTDHKYWAWRFKFEDQEVFVLMNELSSCKMI